MPRPLIGDRPMTAAERDARRRQRQQDYRKVLHELLAEAETGRITAKTVADKCRAALGLANRS